MKWNNKYLCPLCYFLIQFCYFLLWFRFFGHCFVTFFLFWYLKFPFCYFLLQFPFRYLVFLFINFCLCWLEHMSIALSFVILRNFLFVLLLLGLVKYQVKFEILRYQGRYCAVIKYLDITMNTLLPLWSDFSELV